MKINESHFGKKMRLSGWSRNSFFVPMAISPIDGDVYGDLCDLSHVTTVKFENLERWMEWNPPKKKVIKRMAPALCRSDYNKEIYFLSQNIYESKEKAELDYPKKIIKWPASEAMFVEIEVEE